MSITTHLSKLTNRSKWITIFDTLFLNEFVFTYHLHENAKLVGETVSGTYKINFYVYGKVEYTYCNIMNGFLDCFPRSFADDFVPTDSLLLGHKKKLIEALIFANQDTQGKQATDTPAPSKNGEIS